MNRRQLLFTGGLLALPLTTTRVFATIVKAPEKPDYRRSAHALEPLRALAIAHRGTRIFEQGYRGSSPGASINIKSASKSVISALVGIAIARGFLEGTGQKISSLLKQDFPDKPDPQLDRITVGHLLSMQAGLASTSGPFYGAWVLSDNWVKTALARPFVDVPGGQMVYSTGSSHLLSAILTRVSGRSTLALARDWLSPLTGFKIGDWQRDPQGIYFGGNQMAMSARSLLAFGELYRRRGLAADGTRLLSEPWIDASWSPRTRSYWTGDAYGYGWFMRRIGGQDVYFGWGFGGQMIYVVPDLSLTVAILSDATQPSARTGYRNALHRLLAVIIQEIR